MSRAVTPPPGSAPRGAQIASGRPESEDAIEDAFGAPNAMTEIILRISGNVDQEWS